jgi:hypothetical protein
MMSEREGPNEPLGPLTAILTRQHVCLHDHPLSNLRVPLVRGPSTVETKAESRSQRRQGLLNTLNTHGPPQWRADADWPRFALCMDAHAE